MAEEKTLALAKAVQLYKFAKERGALAQCSCGQGEWRVQVRADPDADVAFLGTIPDERFDTYVPVHLLTCSHCGQVRFIAQDTFDAWRQSNG